ncbi:MAG TPA: hypothetical protein V6D30_02275 [Leptolyngbyaceae cyanobacterium]
MSATPQTQLGEFLSREAKINTSTASAKIQAVRFVKPQGSFNMVMAFSYSSGATTVIPSVLCEKRSSYNTNLGLSDVQEPITSAPPEVRQIIERVLQAEKDKLYMKIPRNINDDILKIVKEAVQ